MICYLKNFAKSSILAYALLILSASAMAQDGTIYPLQTPAEPNAILLGTGGVNNQPASETWFRQWGDPMARNITKATLNPFLPKWRIIFKWKAGNAFEVEIIDYH